MVVKIKKRHSYNPVFIEGETVLCPMYSISFSFHSYQCILLFLLYICRKCSKGWLFDHNLTASTIGEILDLTIRFVWLQGSSSELLNCTSGTSNPLILDTTQMLPNAPFPTLPAPVWWRCSMSHLRYLSKWIKSLPTSKGWCDNWDPITYEKGLCGISYIKIWHPFLGFDHCFSYPVLSLPVAFLPRALKEAEGELPRNRSWRAKG